MGEGEAQALLSGDKVSLTKSFHLFIFLMFQKGILKFEEQD